MSQNFVTRFAPSPTGHLHRGHALAALAVFRRALAENGRFILRIEDIDQTRCKPEFVEDLKTDLKWLGLTWEEPVLLQSMRFDAYASALEQLKRLGLVYPCFCTRTDVKRVLESTPQAPIGPDGPIYPGTCRELPHKQANKKVENGEPHAWRLDIEKAIKHVGASLFWHDEVAGDIEANPAKFGDIILARKDTPTSYHLAVVVDDAFQGISHVIRGMDLFEATHIHRFLQELLGLPVPLYHHHPLLKDSDGEKLAKRKGSESIKSIRDQGVSVDNFLKSLEGAF